MTSCSTRPLSFNHRTRCDRKSQKHVYGAVWRDFRKQTRSSKTIHRDQDARQVTPHVPLSFNHCTRCDSKSLRCHTRRIQKSMCTAQFGETSASKPEARRRYTNNQDARQVTPHVPLSFNHRMRCDSKSLRCHNRRACVRCSLERLLLVTRSSKTIHRDQDARQGPTCSSELQSSHAL